MYARRSRGRSLLLGSLVALAAGLVFGVGAAGAKDVNLVPNPGFEIGPCGFDGPIICDWNELNGTMTWDMTNPHSGNASMQLTGPGAPFGVNATTTQNICITVHPGQHAASFWYRTSDEVATNVIFGADWYPNSTCSVATFGFDELNVSPIADGAWHQVSGTLTAPPGTGSAFFAVDESCEGCTATLTVNFDDLVISNHKR
jgi:hypothetical protein